MTEIRNLEQLSRKDVNNYGGKASHLGELMRLGIQVPAGFCISHKTISSLILSEGQNGVDSNAGMKSKLTEVIEPYYTDLSKSTDEKHLLAVRSSASGEDSAGASFAGQFDSILGVHTLDEACDAIILCWKSNSSGRAISYARKRKLADVSMSVIIQQLVVADVAGVCFTCHPVTFDEDTVVVEANWGFGDTVVSGVVTPDHFEVSSATRAVKLSQVACKRRMSKLLSGKVGIVPVSDDQQCKACLSEEDLLKIVDTSLVIQSHFKSPQDIEWVISGGNLFIVQARLVTVTKPIDRGRREMAHV